MSKTHLAIVILAAGQGTRMRSSLPKVMHELAGLPMIGWLLKTAEALNPEKIIVVRGPDMQNLEKAVQPHTTVLQKHRNGTAGALKCAMPELKSFEGNVLVLLGDTPLVKKETLKRLIAAKTDDLLSGLSVLGVKLSDPKGYGRLVTNKDGSLKKIVEEKDASDKERNLTLVNTGAFCLDKARLTSWLEQVGNDNAQKEYYITDLPEIAAKEGATTRIATIHDESEMLGCNTRMDLAVLEATLQNRLRENAMKNGVTLIDPASVYLHHDTDIAHDVVIEPHVFFGPGVKIEKGAYIKAFSYFEGTQIGKNTHIGPFARLRPETVIKDEVRIGNFVEVKKSTIGQRSKINHLSYVGDCNMGDDVNFSAGAITVNYDGFEKHKTTIGKGVLIGSNVNLVAPLSIDDGAFVAAGSTITEDVPADALSISRDSNKIREGWAAEYRKRKESIAKRLRKKKAG